MPDDWRKEKVNGLRKIIKEKGPELTETVKYKMLAYCDDDSIVFCLNAQKNDEFIERAVEMWQRGEDFDCWQYQHPAFRQTLRILLKLSLV